MDYQTWTILGASGPNHLPPCGAARRKSVKYFQVEGNASSLWRRGGESASARQVSWQNGGESAREEKERQVFSSRGKRVKSLAARRRERERKASVLAERRRERTRGERASSLFKSRETRQVFGSAAARAQAQGKYLGRTAARTHTRKASVFGSAAATTTPTPTPTPSERQCVHVSPRRCTRSARQTTACPCLATDKCRQLRLQRSGASGGRCAIGMEGGEWGHLC